MVAELFTTSMSFFPEPSLCAVPIRMVTCGGVVKTTKPMSPLSLFERRPRTRSGLWAVGNGRVRIGRHGHRRARPPRPGRNWAGLRQGPRPLSCPGHRVPSTSLPSPSVVGGSAWKLGVRLWRLRAPLAFAPRAITVMGARAFFSASCCVIAGLRRVWRERRCRCPHPSRRHQASRGCGNGKRFGLTWSPHLLPELAYRAGIAARLTAQSMKPHQATRKTHWS